MQIAGIRTQITIGGLQLLRCPHCVIESERHRPLSRATLTLADAKGELYRTFKPGAAVQIQLGYRDQQPAAWSGTVRWVGRGETKDQIEIGAIDQALVLTTTRIKLVWENETPEAIVTYALRQTGLPIGRVGQTGIVLPKFIASNISVWQLVQQVAVSCQKSFDLDMRRWALWLGSEGVNWGDYDEPGSVPVIATGAGLLGHEPDVGTAVGRGHLVTHLQPGLLHSRQFHLKDMRRGIEAQHRAQRVEHRIEPTKIRTLIDYGAEYVRY